MNRIAITLSKHYFRTWFGPIISIALPILLLVILGNIFKVQYVLPGIISLAVLSIGVISLPVAILDLRNSFLLKFLGSSGVSKIKFITTVTILYIFLSLLSVLLIFATLPIFFHDQVFVEAGKPKDSGVLSGILSLSGSLSFLLSIFIHMIFSIGVGLFIITISNSILKGVSIGITILLISMFTTGMIIPVDVIAKSTALQWISRFNPFRYTTSNLVISSTPLNQTEGILSELTRAEKELIFGLPSVNKFGEVIDVYDNPIHSLTELFAKIDANEMRTPVDHHLYDYLLINNNDLRAASESSNNIFAIQDFSVKKLSSVDEIKVFTKEYLNLDGWSAGQAIPTRFTDLLQKISNNNFDWLDLFFKLTVVLYTKVDIILNITISFVVPVILFTYAYARFNWKEI